jgi:hypothetical protein
MVFSRSKSGSNARDSAREFISHEVRSKGKGAISFFYYSGHGAANPDTQIN